MPRQRGPGERANAQLNAWRILRRIRCCPRRATDLVKAILVLVRPRWRWVRVSRAVYFSMGSLSYTMSISLDGYIEDVTGGIAFSEPDEEVHRFANQQTRETAAFLFGRGLYEVMEEFWTAPERADGGRWRRSSPASTPRRRGSCSPTRWSRSRPGAGWCAAPM